MHYALFPGGKRLRPMLALLGCQAAGGDPRRALRAAAALECLHTYSLVHDDLPCMDDDDLRRGRPTCHKVYGEALALLAGDALLTVAFEGAADAGAAAVVAWRARAGSLGMVGGQVEDLAAEGDAGPSHPAAGAVDPRPQDRGPDHRLVAGRGPRRVPRRGARQPCSSRCGGSAICSAAPSRSPTTAST
jgi:geranylgeranyl diphosphate synthase type II